MFHNAVRVGLDFFSTRVDNYSLKYIKIVTRQFSKCLGNICNIHSLFIFSWQFEFHSFAIRREFTRILGLFVVWFCSLATVCLLTSDGYLIKFSDWINCFSDPKLKLFSVDTLFNHSKVRGVHIPKFRQARKKPELAEFNFRSLIIYPQDDIFF